MRIAIISPGLHRVQRGAEVALESIGRELAQGQGVQVTLFGSGYPRPNEPYDFIHVGNIDRKAFEKWPQIPILRNEYVYEELTFLPELIYRYHPQDFDITLTCSYPLVNWWLRRSKQRPLHVFVTQNSDYPAITDSSEYKWFGCEGLVCTNQEYFDRNKERWNSCLITNGVDAEKFSPQSVARKQFSLPENVPIVLMVSALIPSKRVLEGIKAVSQRPDWHLVICGDGRLREQVLELGNEIMPERLHLKQLSHQQMPDIYRVADVFLHLSIDEPFGNVYLEALATGLPIVAHDRNVTRWILEDTSVLVDSSDQSQIIQGLQKALLEKTKEAVASRRHLIEQRFTWKTIGQQYLDFFTQLTGIA